MGRTTFSGPVRTFRGNINAGPDMVVNVTSNTTLTFADHAGKIVEINDADNVLTLPTISSGSKSAHAGDDDPNVDNHYGAVYTVYIGTAATNLDIQTDGTDKFVGSVCVAVDDGTLKYFIPAATNDVMTMNGTTSGGLVGSFVTFTALTDNQYLVQGVLLGSGVIVTPFADA